MHNFKRGNTSFVYNGDFSGEVVIKDLRTNIVGVNVPFDNLLEFVAEWARCERIRQAEDATATQLLLGK